MKAMARTCYTLALLLLLSGCNLVSESGTQPMGQKPPSAKFQATLEAGEETWQLHGEAEFIDASGEQFSSGQPLFSIQMGVEDRNEIIVIRRNSRRTESGRYDISSTATPGEAFSGAFEQGGFTIHQTAWKYDAESGQLVLDHSTDEVVEGRFEFEAEGRGPYGSRVTLNGSFTAVHPEGS